MPGELEGRKVQEGATIQDAPVTLEEMKACLEIWDQTIGCNHCMIGWWAENATEDLTMFHTDGCPLKGNREAHEDMVNIEYNEKEIGRRLGTVFVQNRQMVVFDRRIMFNDVFLACGLVAVESISRPTELTCIATFGKEKWDLLLKEIVENGFALAPEPT
jgi:hypothetical protein